MPMGGVFYFKRNFLSVKIDYLAMLGEARGNNPDLVEGAVICENAGSDGITVHLWEDRRHIQDKDVLALKGVVRGKFNLEIPLSDEIIGIAKEIKPTQVTIVPEKKHESTEGGGFDVTRYRQKVKDTVKFFHDQDILVSLLVDPDAETVELSKDCDADFVEIHAGTYCNAVDKAVIDREIARIYGAANRAAEIGIQFNAGHGLNYQNVLPVLNAKLLGDVIIGRSIFERAETVGLFKAVDEMLEVLE